MKKFWRGFSEKRANSVEYKKHAIILFWDPSSDGGEMGKIRAILFRHPSIRIRVISVLKDPAAAEKHKVRWFPTVLLLKNGREAGRVESSTSPTVIEGVLRKAMT